MKIKKLILLFPILILFNCSLQKRKYQSGYFLTCNKKISNLFIAKNENQKAFNAKKMRLNTVIHLLKKILQLLLINKIRYL